MPRSFLRRWYRLPERLQLTYSLIFSTVFVSGLLFVGGFFIKHSLKQVAGVSRDTNQATSEILNFFVRSFNKLLTDPADLAIYIGIPFFITIISYLLWQIRKSAVPPNKASKVSKTDDELI